jgi:multimeric flavodoxin WrbA
MEWILDKFYTADGVILATPVYYYNVTSQMKAFMDRNYYSYTRGMIPRARTAGLIVVAESTGIEETVHTLNRFIGASFNIQPDSKFTVTGHANRIGDAEKNLELVEQAREMGRQMANCLA